LRASPRTPRALADRAPGPLGTPWRSPGPARDRRVPGPAARSTKATRDKRTLAHQLLSPPLPLAKLTPTAGRPTWAPQRWATVASRLRRVGEDCPTEAGDGDARRAPLAPREWRLAHATVRARDVLAGRAAAGEAEGRVRAAVSARPRPDRERHALPAPRAAARDVAPREPPRVARGELEDPDPRRVCVLNRWPERCRERSSGS
jgi:hypothetical protein